MGCHVCMVKGVGVIFKVSKKPLKCVDKKYVHIIELSQVKDIWFRNKIIFFAYISQNRDN